MSNHLKFDRRQFLAGTALGAAALAGAAGWPGMASAQARGGGVMRVSTDQAPSKLNPLLHRVNPEYVLGELLYSGLTRLGPEMQAEPDLAESWTSNQELTEWTFKLRPNVTFHDGSKLTAKDVVASFETMLDPKTGSAARTNIGPIARVAAADDTTVVFTLKGAYADLPVALAYTNAKILPAAIITGDMARLDREAIGTGPFKLVSYEPARLTVVERNPNYFIKDRPRLNRIELVVYPDPTAEASALIAGDTDLMLQVSPADYKRVSSASGVKGLRTPSGQFLNVILGCDQKPFNDVRVRKALALAVDREAMVELVAEGLGTPGNDTPINSAYRFYQELPMREANIAQAKKLLAEAGYPNGLNLTLVASDRPSTRTQLGVALRELAKPAGFNIEVQTMPHATYLDQVWTKGAFYVGFYNMQPTADGIFSLLYTSDAAWNETKWNNKEFDQLIVEARSTADEAKRRDLYAQAQKLMHEEVPTVIPVFFDLLSAQRDYVQGYQLHPRGAVYRLDYVSLSDKAPKRG
jgi:peptide/nickel transport system substrate-binding protein